MKKPKVKISETGLMMLIHWARRYCDGRSTFAPSFFNAIYQRIKLENPELIEKHEYVDTSLMEDGKYWPYAQDGMYDPEKKLFDARPMENR